MRPQAGAQRPGLRQAPRGRLQRRRMLCCSCMTQARSMHAPGRCRRPPAALWMSPPSAPGSPSSARVRRIPRPSSMQPARMMQHIGKWRSSCCRKLRISAQGVLAGLPFRGAPLLLPVDVHAALTRLHGSLAARITAQFLLLQLPLPGLCALQSLAQAIEPIQACMSNGHGSAQSNPFMIGKRLFVLPCKPALALPVNFFAGRVRARHGAC